MRKKLFVFCTINFCVLLILLGLQADTNAQYLQKKNPLIEEIVAKVSLEEIIKMHDVLVSFETRNTYSDTVSDTRGVGAARRYIYSKFQEFSRLSGGRLKVYYDSFEKELDERAAEATGMDKVRLVNVVAVLPGKTDDVRFIVNGHYDSMTNRNTDKENPAPGANDDASGTVATMELARVLSQYEFEHTLVFSANIAEEQGLWGARHMNETAENEKWEIGGVIANDIMGNIWGQNGIINNSAIRVFSKGPDPKMDDSKSRHFARYIKYIGEPYAPELRIKLIFRLDRFGRGGDHSPFDASGFPAVRFTEMNESFDRQHGISVDISEFVSREYITKVARLQAAVLGTAASAPKAVKVISQRRDRSTMTTDLRWTHDTKENDIAGYKVFIRNTDVGYWEEIMDVGMVEKQVNQRNNSEFLQVKIPGRSVDDFIFGVAAYDADGNEGVVATYEPRPRGSR